MAKPLKRFLVSALREDDQKTHPKGGTVFLTPDETHHIKNVLHMKEGTVCLLFDSKGREFLSRLERFLPDGCLEARLLKPVSGHDAVSAYQVGTYGLPPAGEAGTPLHLTAAQAIPQDRKMDEIVRKSAELGIFELIPLITERTVVRITQKQYEKVGARWERILTQTLKQSRIRNAPSIASPVMFDDLCLRFAQYDKTFLFHPSPQAMSLRDLCTAGTGFKPAPAGAPRRILILIGPEGGFSEREVKEVLARGAQAVRMGSGILKTDTAFVAAASFFSLMYA